MQLREAIFVTIYIPWSEKNVRITVFNLCAMQLYAKALDIAKVGLIYYTV